jgi:peptide/nickel transport system substrate-binding protein
MEMLSGKFKLDALKREVEQGGYKGEKVVFLGASDVARISAICQVGADVLSKIGLNVDYVTTDWGTVVQRITRKQPIAEGGWSIFGSMWGGYDWYSPAGNAALRGNGMNAWFGWPDAPKLEALQTSGCARRTWRRRRRWLGISSCRRSRMCRVCRLGCTTSPWRIETIWWT